MGFLATPCRALHPNPNRLSASGTHLPAHSAMFSSSSFSVGSEAPATQHLVTYDWAAVPVRKPAPYRTAYSRLSYAGLLRMEKEARSSTTCACCHVLFCVARAAHVPGTY